MYSLIGIFILAVLFLNLERRFPGRTLPNSKAWYLRAVFFNLVQFSLVFIAGATWNKWFQSYSLFDGESFFAQLPFLPAVVEAFVYWFLGTFIFYWWHRLRHQNGWWQIFHQIHHSPTRIEAMTAFYKHPLEMLVNSVIISTFLFLIFGGSVEAAGWYNFFGVAGELFYHSNLRTPRFLGYFLQRPEHHSIHHQMGVHNFNFGDITLWDRLFGTFKETDVFMPECGFDEQREEKLLSMLTFKDVHK